MRRHIQAEILAGLVAAAVLAGAPACASAPADRSAMGEPGALDELGRIRQAVERALVTAPPRGYAAIPRGVRLLSVEEDEGRIVLDLSAELLIAPQRVIEDALHQILAAAADAREPSPGRVDEFQVLVNGVTLESYLP